MRISTNPNDLGYRNFIGKRFRVFLNGFEVVDALTADEEMGFVTLYKKDQNGAWVATPTGVIEEEIYFGAVRIEEITAIPPTPEAARIAAKRALREFH